MFRKALIKNQTGGKKFEWRSREVHRIEAFSDAVFAFAVTLLIVSLEVPETFTELLNTMQGFFAFAFSFAILFQIWYAQYKYFRLYGLEDLFTIILNGILIFVVLFYVYPLKFLFRLMFYSGNPGGIHKTIIEQSQAPQLMVIYGIGFLAIYMIFVLLYWHAYKKRGELKLTGPEIFFTKTELYNNVIMVIIALTAIAAALIVNEKDAGRTGFVYFLIGPAISVFHTIRGKMSRRMFEN